MDLDFSETDTSVLIESELRKPDFLDFDFSEEFWSMLSQRLVTDHEDAIDTVNRHSELVAAAQTAKRKCCPIYENCDGSCSDPDSHVTYKPLVSGASDRVTKIASNPDSEIVTHGSPWSDSNRLEEFKYTPISSEPSVIRLLRIKQAHRRIDPIECELVDVPLDKTPEYAALSYHWGEPIFNHRIVCNGQALAVTSNLHGALKRYRQDSRFIQNPLWVDAICINQKDKLELNTQLLMMRRIFNQAEVVHIDLGDAPDNWYPGFDLVHRLYCVARLVSDQKAPTYRQMFEVYGLPYMDHPAWGAYFHLFSAPWFRRTWVIQEVVLARRGVVMYGDFDFEWNHFALSFYFLNKKVNMIGHLNARLRIRDEGIMGMLCMLEIHGCYGRSVLTPLSLLDSTAFSNVSNLKDKVFAILALLDATDGGFKPDYSLPVDQVYQDFAAHVVHTGDGVDMLSYAGLQYRACVPNIASWIPDWSARMTTPNAKMIFRNPPFQAGGSSRSYTAVVGDDQNGQTMVVQGSLLDAITLLSSSLCVELTSPSSVKQALQEWYESASCTFQEANSSRTLKYDSCLDAFCRTLIADDLKELDLIKGPGPVWITDPVLSNKRAMAAWKDDHARFGSLMDDVFVYRTNTLRACIARRFSITEKGFMGLVPNCAQVGDRIFIPLGSKVPFVLRAKGDGTFLLAGETYIHGIMDGEALEFPDFCFKKIVLS